MNSKSLFHDIKSGIVVSWVALPLSLGIAVACGAPVISGIIASIVGGILVTKLSSSQHSVSGPAMTMTAVIISAVAELGSYEAFLAALIFAGILQCLMGFIKIGNIGNFIPNAVLKGMLAGIGIILIIKQLPHVFGYDAIPEGDMNFEQADGHNSFSDLYFMFNNISLGSLIIGVICFTVYLVLEKQYIKTGKLIATLPVPFITVLTGVALNVLFHFIPALKLSELHLAYLPLDDVFTNHTFADFSKLGSYSFWTTVVLIAVLTSLETLLNVEALEKIDPNKHNINQNKELLAQGIGNTVSGLLGGLPITSSIVRSSANVNAQAKSKISSYVHALLLFTVVIYPKLLMLIPNSCLAVILIMIGIKLAHISVFKEQLKGGLEQFLPYIITILAIAFSTLLYGVYAGLLISIIYIIRNNIRFSFEVIEETIEGRSTHLMKLPQHITFFNKGFVTQYLNAVKPGSKIIIDGTLNKNTDKDVQEVFRDFIQTSRQRNIKVQLIKYTI